MATPPQPYNFGAEFARANKSGDYVERFYANMGNVDDAKAVTAQLKAQYEGAKESIHIMEVEIERLEKKEEYDRAAAAASDAAAKRAAAEALQETLKQLDMKKKELELLRAEEAKFAEQHKQALAKDQREGEKAYSQSATKERTRKAGQMSGAAAINTAAGFTADGALDLTGANAPQPPPPKKKKTDEVAIDLTGGDDDDAPPPGAPPGAAKPPKTLADAADAVGGAMKEVLGLDKPMDEGLAFLGGSGGISAKFDPLTGQPTAHGKFELKKTPREAAVADQMARDRKKRSNSI